MSNAAQGVLPPEYREPRAQILHILAVPFRSEGHVNAMLRLAQALVAEPGVLITFAYPARFHGLALKRNKLSALLNSSSSSSAQSIRVEVIADGLPEEEQAFPNVFEQATFPIFYTAIELLLDDLLQKSKPSSDDATPLPPVRCIIADTFNPRVQDIADAAGLLRVDFWTSTAASYSMGTHLSLLVADGTLPLPKSCWLDSNKWSVTDAPLIKGVPGLPPFPPTDLLIEAVHAEELSDPKLQFMLGAYGRVREAHTILVHSVYELESEVFDALQESGLPIHAVGPLPDSVSESSELIKAKAAKQECIQWLDQQPPSSVIYVAFGSVAKLTIAEMQALALGLEASGHRFLWVVRRGATFGTLAETLPEGFLQRTVEKGRGLIISWSPQAEVLCHHAVGAFFSHCGWNSTVECMWEGIPMVACPRGAEQRSNARWIVQNWKIGVELERQQDGSFTKEAVERAFKEVLGKNGLTYKEHALHCKKIARSAMQKGGTSHSNLIDFLQHLRHFSARPARP